MTRISRRFLLVSFAAALSLLLLASQGAQAQKTSERPSKAPNKIAVKADKDARLALRLKRIQQLGERMIDLRLRALGVVEELIVKAPRIPEEDKDSLTALVRSESSSLESLRNTLESSTDLESAKNKVRSIIRDHHIFVLFIPKIRGLAVISKLEQLTAKLEGIKEKIAARIESEKSSGRDMSEEERLLADFASKVAEAKQDASQAGDLLKVLEVSGDPKGSRSDLKEARKLLRDARVTLLQAAADLRRIIAELKKA